MSERTVHFTPPVTYRDINITQRVMGLNLHLFSGMPKLGVLKHKYPTGNSLHIGMGMF
jgi:hypothetical protein